MALGLKFLAERRQIDVNRTAMVGKMQVRVLLRETDPVGVFHRHGLPRFEVLTKLGILGPPFGHFKCSFVMEVILPPPENACFGSRVTKIAAPIRCRHQLRFPQAQIYPKSALRSYPE